MGAVGEFTKWGTRGPGLSVPGCHLEMGRCEFFPKEITRWGGVGHFPAVCAPLIHLSL